MKFTEVKLEKADIMVNGQLLMVNESFVLMSSFWSRKLDNFQNVQFFC